MLMFDIFHSITSINKKHGCQVITRKTTLNRSYNNYNTTYYIIYYIKWESVSLKVKVYIKKAHIMIYFISIEDVPSAN